MKEKERKETRKEKIEGIRCLTQLGLLRSLATVATRKVVLVLIVRVRGEGREAVISSG